MKKLQKLLLVFIFFLAACQTPEKPNVINVTPVIKPSAVIIPSPQPTQNVSQKGKLTVIVNDGNNQKPVANASVKVTSANGTNMTQITNSEGKSIFDSLPESINYNVEVSAAGYKSNSVSTSSAKLEIKADNPVYLTVNLFKSQVALTGKVLNNNGQPVEGAIIKAGDNSGLSQADGTFNINITNIANLPVNISKTGFTAFSYGNVDFSKQGNLNIGEIKLTQSLSSPVILFDISKVPFGNVEGANVNLFSKLNNVLNSAKYKTLFIDFFAQPNLDEIDTVVIASPFLDYSDAEIDKLSTFIKSGKKLVILGEWGGYGGFKADSLNNLLKEANLRINPDIVKEVDPQNFQATDEQIVTSAFNPHYITRNLTKLAFYSSASVEVINGGIKTLDTNNTKLLALSTSASFRIQTFNRGQFGLAGVSTLGSGKIVVLGDSSIFTDSDSNDNGISNLNEFSNQQFALNIFSW